MLRTFTNLYMVYDTVAEELFGSTIRASNDEVARRSFHDLLKDENSPIAGHRGDYILVCLAKIDNHGRLYNHDANEIDVNTRVIAKGQDWLDANTSKPELLK